MVCFAAAKIRSSPSKSAGVVWRTAAQSRSVFKEGSAAPVSTLLRKLALLCPVTSFAAEPSVYGAA